METAGQLASGGKALLNGTLHDLPDVQQIVPDILALVELHVIDEADVPELAELLDLGKGVFQVCLFTLVRGGTALHQNIAAADAADPLPGQLLAIPEGHQVHGIGVLDVLRRLLGEDHLRGNGGEGFDDGPVGAVALAGLGEGTVEGDAVGVRLHRLLPEVGGGLGGAHGVGTGRSFADLVNITDGFHDALRRESPLPRAAGEAPLPPFIVL